MIIDIRREYFKEATVGDLLINDVLICHTLELPYLDNKKKVSCIPEGTYKAAFTYSLRFKKELIALQKVPNRTGILIHSGNTVSDTEGCILVGGRISRDIMFRNKKWDFFISDSMIKLNNLHTHIKLLSPQEISINISSFQNKSSH